MTSLGPTYNGLDQNYDFIYEALLEGATVYLRIANYNNSGLTYNFLVTHWTLDQSAGLVLYNETTNYLVFSNGSYHTNSGK